jgi:hypothetical protein
MKPILIHKSDSTIFANVNKFLTFNLETDLDLTGWQAKFILGWVEKTIDDISSKSFEIILDSQDTKQLRLGKQYGTIILTDSNGNIKTVTNTIPFEVTTAVVENEYQEIDLTIPESSGVDIKLKVGAETVTSVNGMTGDVNLTAQDVGALPVDTYIPSIDGLATKEELTPLATKQELQQGLDTKQPVGEYLTEIPEEYVKKTDYASGSKGGVIKTSGTDFGTQMNTNGFLCAFPITNEAYNTADKRLFVSKATLENIKDDYVKRGVTENTIELSDTEKASAKQWLGFATPAEIMQAIASIPQFSISLVDELPLAGEKMVLYLVSKGGESPDVYDEYIWIEQTSSFEFLGTTAVDLTDYVKNTDYATSSVGGVTKVDSSFGTQISSNGYIHAYTENLTRYKQRNGNFVIGKGTLENIKNDLVKRAVTENDIELTADEQTNARTWLNAVGKEDYATADNAGTIMVNSYYGTQMLNKLGLIGASIRTLDLYNKSPESLFIGKGTLENVLTQYKKVSDPMTEEAYNALATKDSNTLYLIEE